MKIKIGINKINNIKKEITAAKNNTSVLLSPEDYKLYIHHKNQTLEVSPIMSANLNSAIIYEIPDIKHSPEIQSCISRIANQLSNIDRSNEERSNENEKDSSDNSEEENENSESNEDNNDSSQDNQNNESDEQNNNDKDIEDELLSDEKEDLDDADNNQDDYTDEELLEFLDDNDDDITSIEDEIQIQKECENKSLIEEFKEEDKDKDKDLDNFKVVKELLKKDNKKLKKLLKQIIENGEDPKEKEGIKKALKNPKNEKVINKLIQEAEHELKFDLPENPKNDNNTIYFLNQIPDWIKKYIKDNKYKKEARKLEKALRKLLNDLGLDAYSPRLDAKEVVKRVETARDPSKAYKREIENRKTILAFDISGSMEQFIPVTLPALRLSSIYPNIIVILHTNFGINCVIEKGKIIDPQINYDIEKSTEVWKSYIENIDTFISLSDWDGSNEWMNLFKKIENPPKNTYWLMPFKKENLRYYSKEALSCLNEEFKNVIEVFSVTSITDYVKVIENLKKLKKLKKTIITNHNIKTNSVLNKQNNELYEAKEEL